jgi:NitT/TauT family transport system substrate-binding protein
MRRVITLIIIILIIAIIGISFLILRGRARKLEEVKIGYMPYTSNLPLFVALEKGFFKNEGLEVKTIKFGSSKEAMDALLTGKIDAEGTIGLSTLFAIEAASPGQIKFYLPCVETKNKFANYLLVRKDSSISTVKDLKGKRIGTYTGTTQLLFLKLLLQKLGLDPEKDVKIIQVSPQLEIEAFSAGQFDALFTIEPAATIAMEKGIGKPLLRNPRCEYIISPFPAGAFPFSTNFLREDPDKAKRIYRAIDKAVDFIKTHEDEAKRLVPKYTGLEETIALKTGLYEWWKMDEIKIEPMQKLADLLFEYKDIPAKIDVSKMVLTREDLR